MRDLLDIEAIHERIAFQLTWTVTFKPAACAFAVIFGSSFGSISSPDSVSFFARIVLLGVQQNDLQKVWLRCQNALPLLRKVGLCVNDVVAVVLAPVHFVLIGLF